MKYVRTALLLPVYVFVAWLFTGCAHAQVTPTAYQVDLSWTAPVASGTWAGCGNPSTCTYVVSRYTFTATDKACPTPNTTTANYTPLNAAAPVSVLTLNDTTASGTTACYIAQTEQGSPAAVSQPSNVLGPLVVPGSPLAPALGGAAATTADVKPLPLPSAASGALVLSARLSPVR